MFEQFMWQKFFESGNICDYLVLKEESEFSASEEGENAFFPLKFNHIQISDN